MKKKLLLGTLGILLASLIAFTGCDDVLAEIQKGLGAAVAEPMFADFAEVVAQMEADAEAGIQSAAYTLNGDGGGETYLDDLMLIPDDTCPATVTIDGGIEGGWNVTGEGNSITVESGVTLILKNITFKNIPFIVEADGTLILEKGAVIRDNAGAGITVNGTSATAKGTLEMEADSSVTGNHDSGVRIDGTGGVFTMNGGTISGNDVVSTEDEAGGGGVAMWGADSEFTMNGGTISGNDANRGGGVAMWGADSKFTMNGGEISGNTTPKSGGGVFLYGDSAIFTMHDGTISDNNGTWGGGVAVYGEGGTFTLGNGEIKNNTSVYFGGGVYIYSNDGKFNMINGDISGNKAEQDGGGVVLWKDLNITFEMSGGTIQNNEAFYDGGGVYALWTSTFNMRGGEITDNSAGWDGGGVYLASGGTLTGDPQIGGTDPGPERGWIHGNTPDDVYYFD